MLRSISMRQFIEWQVFSEVEPFDETRADYRTSAIIATLMNIYRKKRAKAIKLSDVALLFGDSVRVKPQADWKALKAMGQLAAAAFNAQHAADEKKRQRRKGR